MTEFHGNAFAHACIESNSINELETALQGYADKTDMNQWGLTAAEWREQIEMALIYLNRYPRIR